MISCRTRKLTATNNQIRQIVVVLEKNIYVPVAAGDAGLEILNLSDNKLSDISNITLLNRLRELDLSRNLLVEIDMVIFNSLSMLTKLSLSGNLLQTIELLSSVRLISLDVSYNHLQNLEFLEHFPQLKELNIKANSRILFDVFYQLKGEETVLRLAYAHCMPVKSVSLQCVPVI